MTIQSILNECNRLAGESYSKEKVLALKSRLLRARLDYEKGAISEEEYNMLQSEILKSMGDRS